MGYLVTSFSEICIKPHNIVFKEMHLEMWYVKYQPLLSTFCHTSPSQWRHMNVMSSQITDSWTFVQQLFRLSTKKKNNVRVSGLLWGNPSEPTDSHYKEPVMRTAFLIMTSSCCRRLRRLCWLVPVECLQRHLRRRRQTENTNLSFSGRSAQSYRSSPTAGRTEYGCGGRC